ncbi:MULTISPECIES: histidine kinase N-terminal 7TM domain-containing protein [Halorussus]|uniref:histidine kinase N-terminal 7TM domain-containing protein n=1 Tax=Halorussus TaxID=1070314 RepID=UPI000E20F693|nr:MULTISPECIES: histidine kinase N-terminal 7TM domain-containing protein [Halorussus]NHN61376.1 PAS domain S-box protein [Halorussus sp. JP-T4]
MDWQHTAHVYPMLIGGFVSAVLAAYGAAYARRRRRRTVVLSFVGLNLAIAVWTIVTAVKVLSLDPAVKLLAFKLFHVGSTFASPLFFAFALAYTDRSEWLTRPTLAALFAVPSVTLLLLFVNPNSVAIIDWRLVASGGVTTIEVQSGPASVLRIAYGLVLDLFAIGLILQYAVRSRWDDRKQAGFLLVGVVPPAVVVYLELADVYPPDGVGVNLLPASLAFTAVSFGVAVFRYKLFGALPLAYRTTVEHSPTGIVVLEEDERIVYRNPAAESLFGLGSAVGDDAADAIPEYDALRDGLESATVRAGPDRERYLDVFRRPLRRGGATVGWVLTAHDVTSQRTYQRELEATNDQLEILNRVVRHDVTNDVSVVTLYLRLALDRDDLGEEVVDELRTALEYAEHIDELTDTVADLMRVMLEDDEMRPMNLCRELEETAEQVRQAYPEASVAVPPDLPDVRIRANDLLGSALLNVITNAVIHNDTDAPEVDVSLAVTEETAVVRIADDGPGIPDDRKETVFGRGEKGLESPGTGIGLYLVDRIVSGFDGDVRVADNDPRGTVVAVELPIATDVGGRSLRPSRDDRAANPR